LDRTWGQDHLNHDVCDYLAAGVDPNVSARAAALGINSTNASWETVLDTFLDAMDAENPDFVMVAGDMFGGRWTYDGLPEGDNWSVFSDGQGLFGPIFSGSSDPGRTLAVENARVELTADTYYPQWLDRFTDDGRSMGTVLAAVGDHEVGDDLPWDLDPLGLDVVPTYRAKFSEHIVDPIVNNGTVYSQPSSGQHADSAYSVKHKNMMVITLDVFKQETDGSITATVDGDQLDWVEDQIDDAKADPNIDHIIVQGHTPIKAPVPARNSSELLLEDGTNSAIWQLMDQEGVDFYFAGEVHDVSVRQDGSQSSLLQVVHGAAYGHESLQSVNYLVGTVDGDRIDLEIKSIGMTPSGGSLYQPGTDIHIKDNLELDIITGFESMGTITVDKSTGTPVFSNASGVFDEEDNPVAGPTYHTMTSTGSWGG